MPSHSEALRAQVLVPGQRHRRDSIRERVLMVLVQGEGVWMGTQWGAGSGSQSKASEGLGFRTRVKGLIMVSCKYCI